MYDSKRQKFQGTFVLYVRHLTSPRSRGGRSRYPSSGSVRRTLSVLPSNLMSSWLPLSLFICLSSLSFPNFSDLETQGPPSVTPFSGYPDLLPQLHRRTPIVRYGGHRVAGSLGRDRRDATSHQWSLLFPRPRSHIPTPFRRSLWVSSKGRFGSSVVWQKKFTQNILRCR